MNDCGEGGMRNQKEKALDEGGKNSKNEGKTTNLGEKQGEKSYKLNEEALLLSENSRSPKISDLRGKIGNEKKVGQKNEDVEGNTLELWKIHFGDPVESLKKHLNNEAKKHNRSEWIFEVNEKCHSTPFQEIDPHKEPKLRKSKYVVPRIISKETWRISSMLADRPKLAQIWRNCYPYTLERTTINLSDGMVFIKTGDIPHMWLRDSCGQVQQYLPLVKRDRQIDAFFQSLIKRHTHQITYNPYASAFGWKGGSNDAHLGRSMYIKQHNFELDSICYPIDLAWKYWKFSGSGFFRNISLSCHSVT